MGPRARQQSQKQKLALLLSTFAMSGLAHADAIDAFWLGGTGSWNDPTKWSGGVVPNNGSGNTYRAFIPSGNVTLNFLPGTIIDSLNLDAPSILTVVRNFEILDTTVINGLLTAHAPTTLGPVGSLSGSGKILSSAGSVIGKSGLEIPSTLTVETRGYAARLGFETMPFTNRGYIYGGLGGENFRPRVCGTPFQNLGTIESQNGCIAFSGTFTRADLGNLVWGTSGSFGIGFNGILENDGQTLTVDASHPWEINEGTIHGGTIDIVPGSALHIPFVGTTGGGYGGTLDNVIVNGKITHNGDGALNIKNGVLAGNVEIVMNMSHLEGPARLTTINPTLTIGPGAVVRGGGGFIPFIAAGTNGIGDGSIELINYGKIRSDAPSFGASPFGLFAKSVTNHGILSVGTTSYMIATRDQTTPADMIFAPGGILEINMGTTSGASLLQVTGELDLSALGDSLVLTRIPQVQPFTFYRIVTTGEGILGQFDFVTPGFEVMYTSNEIFARAVPEPAVLSAAGALYFINRRRKER